MKESGVPWLRLTPHELTRSPACVFWRADVGHETFLQGAKYWTVPVSTDQNYLLYL